MGSRRLAKRSSLMPSGVIRASAQGKWSRWSRTRLSELPAHRHRPTTGQSSRYATSVRPPEACLSLKSKHPCSRQLKAASEQEFHRQLNQPWEILLRDRQHAETIGRIAGDRSAIERMIHRVESLSAKL